MNKILSAFTKKSFTETVTNREPRKRYITLFQLTLMTIGCIMGSGVYMASGIMINKQAGPSSIFSFLFAGIMAILFGLIYAEVGTRMPRSGSFYAFGCAIYGDMIGFIIGTHFFISYTFAGVTVVKSLSFYIDSLCYNAISHYFSTVRLPDSYYFEDSLNPMPLFIVILLAFLFVFKSENSTKVAITLVFINLLVLLTVIIGGSQLTNATNWSLNAPNKTDKTSFGNGGFMPYGVSGIFVASLGAFFSLSGVEIIAVIAGDVIDPIKTIPRSTILAILIATIAYVSTTAVISLMMPYYKIDVKAPYSVAFFKKGNMALSYVVSVGCICGLASNLYGTIFSAARLLYSMILDGFLKKLLYHASGDKMIRNTSLLFCLIIGLLSIFVTTETALGISEISVLVPTIILNIMIINIRYSRKPFLHKRDDEFEDLLTEKQIIIARVMTAIATLFSMATSILIRFLPSNLSLRYSVISLLVSACIVSLIALQRLPKIEDNQVYMTPMIPFLPIVSNFFIFILIVYIDEVTWKSYLIIFGLIFTVYLVSTVIDVLWQLKKEKLENSAEN